MKQSKAAAGFEHPAKGMMHCGLCRNWLPPDDCMLVEGDDIDVADWCRLFSAKSGLVSAALEVR